MGVVGENRHLNVDRLNAEFWNELCGTGLAQYLEIKDSSPQSLKIFDDWYLGYYPYLLRHVKPERMRGRKVLEVGLGYGTLGQKIAEAGAEYAGLDVAERPVRIMNQRLKTNGLGMQAVVGSMLDCPYCSSTFDFVVSIGCFHHTGDVQRCIDEAYRVLKPDGTAVLMLYNALSYRQWARWPGRTFSSLMSDFGFSRSDLAGTEEQRKAYDANIGGDAAPETIFLTVKQMRTMLSKYSTAAVHKENCEDWYFRGRLLASRRKLLSSWGRIAGLDVYVEAEK